MLTSCPAIWPYTCFIDFLLRIYKEMKLEIFTKFNIFLQFFLHFFVIQAPELSPKEKAERAKIEREENIKAENATLELMLADLTQVSEAAMKAATEAQKTLVETIKKHTQLLKSALENETEVCI